MQRERGIGARHEKGGLRGGRERARENKRERNKGANEEQGNRENAYRIKLEGDLAALQLFGIHVQVVLLECLKLHLLSI